MVGVLLGDIDGSLGARISFTVGYLWELFITINSRLVLNQCRFKGVIGSSAL